ncbi:hypothetical protein SBOR_8860 [Sclerotinia borealis F-4128]|uniref:Uncharacterized protein n=1 Tax=Sclerotinia borealis (strain F-4128) TaxID=1432307 RepID=W9C1Q9_SCLBF|nr:hypothetical protein SBOR_8860 [Sclerotinia borealis F-4128]
MPVTTRSQSKRRLLSIPKDVESHLHLSKTSSSDGPLQNLDIHSKNRQCQSKRQSKLQSKRQSRKQPPKQHHKYQQSNQEKPLRGSTNPNLPSTTMTHYPCNQCNCPQGVFELLIPICVNCRHTIEYHNLPDISSWNPNCPNVCERQHVVSTVLQQAQYMRVVVIRATPLVGKTTLLSLLGRHILHQREDLEPVFIYWESKDQRNNIPYKQYLKEQVRYARIENAIYRPCNPNARVIFLIDEAQGSYEDEAFWSFELKKPNTRRQPIFVLVCLYGSIGLPGNQNTFESQALKVDVDALNRIELRPSKHNSLCMLFKSEETLIVVSKWVLENSFKPESVDLEAIAEYIHTATDGHPGMVGFILSSFELLIKQSRPGSSEITYIFASPIHRRIAYRRLIPGPPPGINSDKATLQQTCLNAIERFSPSVFHHRSPSSNGNKLGIPEAAFQDEMYCCLNYELHSLPILAEYADTPDGRIDFYIFDKKWGIEILRSGNNGRLEEHASRFKPEGKYHKWGILEDYIILNFCSKSFLDTLHVRDIDIQSHMLHIVIDAKECTAEVYTYDKQLRATLNLGEGRQRSYSTEKDSAAEDDDPLMTIRDLKIEAEQWKQEKQEMEREKQEMEQEMERKILELQQQLSQR